MKELNKVYNIHNYKFNFKIKLFTKINDRFLEDIKKFHTLSVSCMDGINYVKEYQINDKDLESSIAKIYIETKEWVENRLNITKTDLILKNLGFE